MRAMFLLFAALLFVPPALAGPLPDEIPGWRILRTPHDYRTLIQRVDAAVKESPINVVTRASATIGAKNLGLTIPGNMVVGVYGPKFAVRMLEASIAAGIEAPLRLYLTENADGTATLSYKLPSFVFAPYFADGGEKLKSLAAELDGILASIADRAAAP